MELHKKSDILNGWAKTQTGCFRYNRLKEQYRSKVIYLRQPRVNPPETNKSIITFLVRFSFNCDPARATKWGY